MYLVTFHHCLLLPLRKVRCPCDPHTLAHVDPGSCGSVRGADSSPCDGGGAGCGHKGAFPPAALTSAARRGSPARLKLQDRKHALWLTDRLETTPAERHGGSREGFPRQSGLPQTGGPENDVGRPGEIHGAAGDRLRSVRDSVVSVPGEGAHGCR